MFSPSTGTGYFCLLPSGQSEKDKKLNVFRASHWSLEACLRCPIRRCLRSSPAAVKVYTSHTQYTLGTYFRRLDYILELNNTAVAIVLPSR